MTQSQASANSDASIPELSPLKQTQTSELTRPEEDRRLILLRTAADIASLAHSSSDLQDLLSQTANLIYQRLGYYHTAIYLLDDSRQLAQLQAAAGQSASEFTVQRRRIVVGSRSLVGWVAAHNRPRLAGDVSQEFFYQRDDQLPDTHSEVAVPLSVSGIASSSQVSQEEVSMGVLGVLDVQHSQENAFDPETVTVLQTIASQIAAIIQNYKLLENTRRGLDEISQLYQLSREIARAEDIGDIRNAIYHFLPLARYPATLLTIQPAVVSAEDLLVPFSLTGEQAEQTQIEVAGEEEQLQRSEGEQPVLYLRDAEACLQLSQPNPLDYLILDLGVGAASDHPEGEDKQDVAAEQAEGNRSRADAYIAFARNLDYISAALIPITRLGHLEMLLLLGSPQEYLIPENLQTYLGLADFCKTALERVYAMQAMQEHLTMLQTLSKIGQAVSLQTDLNQLYSIIHNEVSLLMGEVSFLIALYHPIDQTIEVPYLFEMGSDGPRQLPTFALGEGMTSIVINTRQPLMLVEDTERRSRELGARLYGAPARSWLGVPLLVGGEVMGAIVVQDIYKERRFDEDDLRLMLILASQVAVSIRNARLLDSTHQQAERERILNEITAQIRASSDPQKILQTTTRELARILGARRAQMVLSPSSPVADTLSDAAASDPAPLTVTPDKDDPGQEILHQ